MQIRFSRKKLCIPYVAFLIFFVIAPLLVVFYYAFTNGQGEFTLSNLAGFFTDSNTIGTLCYSLVIALTTTVVCLVIAYPVAYILARSNMKRKSVMLLIFITPMWINFTLRIAALKEILTFIEGNLAFHPFMILPLYNTISKLDKNLLEAAGDLGANACQTFIKVTLPLSVPGIISGVTMVFLPAMTNYVVLDMLYNSTYIMGSLIGSYFHAYNWNSGSMISIVLLVIILIITIATNGFSEEENKEAVL